MSKIVGPAELRKIVDRLAQYDGSVIHWSLVRDGPVERLVVDTRNAAFCGFAVEVNANGGADYGFHFGHGPQIDSLDPAEFDPLVVAEAVIAGSVTERLWRLGTTFIVKSAGRVTLNGGLFLSDINTRLPLLAAVARVSDVTYYPYPQRS